VLWIMPYSPNCSRPKSLAVMTDAARLEPCEITAPMSDQTAPLANRPRSESAAHVRLIALVAPFHDLISVGIKSNLPAVRRRYQVFLLPAYSRSPNSVCRTYKVSK